MKNKYQTVYKTSYRELAAQFKEEMTFKEATLKGRGSESCLDKNGLIDTLAR